MERYKRHLLGENAEAQALAFLKNQGLILLEQNYRCKQGEIDLIMRDQQQVAFVEVRSRNSMRYGHALESIDYYKQRKIIYAANHYLQIKRWLYKVISRFDIITLQSVNGQMQLRWLKNAFTAKHE